MSLLRASAILRLLAPSRTARRVVIPLATLVLALGGVELFLRSCAPVYFGEPEAPIGTWAEVHVPARVPNLAYELAASVDTVVDGVPVHTNSLGMRDGEPLPEDTPGLCRIAVLGDSIAFGWGVNQEQGFCDQLERALGATPGSARRYDVLNFAVTGYSTQDEVEQYVQRVEPLHPDLVVVAYCLNDPAVTRNEALFSGDAWWQSSHLARLVAKRIHKAKVRKLGGGNYYRFLHSPEGDEWPSVVNAFERLRQATERAGIPVLVVIFPWPLLNDRWEDYVLAPVHEQVARLARDKGFAALDLLPAFEKHQPLEVEISTRDPHPTALGHAIAAEEVARAVLAKLNDGARAGASQGKGTDGER